MGLQLASGAGGGCGADFLGLLDKNRTRLADGNSEKALEQFHSNCDRTVLRPVVYDGAVYMELADGPVEHETALPLTIHKIYQIREGTLNLVCDYRVLAQYRIMSYPERVAAAAVADHFDNAVLYAIHQPGTTVLERLIEAGVDLNRPTEESTPLQKAIELDRDDLTKMLLDNGANPNLPSKTTTPLLEAIWRGTPKSVELLLEHGADPNLSSTYGTPLDGAVWRGTRQSVESLLKHGANPNDRNALVHILGRSHEVNLNAHYLKLFIQHGLDPNGEFDAPMLVPIGRNNGGDSGYGYLTVEGDGVFTAGDDLSKHPKGKPSYAIKLHRVRLLEYAESQGSTTIVTILEQAGAK
ncbi:MAG: ankyrin repeat domain-containing protein [Gammaproteobacteria bacterium]